MASFQKKNKWQMLPKRSYYKNKQNIYKYKFICFSVDQLSAVKSIVNNNGSGKITVNYKLLARLLPLSECCPKTDFRPQK